VPWNSLSPGGFIVGAEWRRRKLNGKREKAVASGLAPWDSLSPTASSSGERLG